MFGELLAGYLIYLAKENRYWAQFTLCQYPLSLAKKIRYQTAADAHDEFVSEYSVPRIITQYQGLSGFLDDFCLHICIKLSVSHSDDGVCLLSCHISGSFPKGDGRECVFSRDNHKTASCVIDIEVIDLIQDKISLLGLYRYVMLFYMTTILWFL